MQFYNRKTHLLIYHIIKRKKEKIKNRKCTYNINNYVSLRDANTFSLLEINKYVISHIIIAVTL